MFAAPLALLDEVCLELQVNPDDVSHEPSAEGVEDWPDPGEWEQVGSGGGVDSMSDQASNVSDWPDPLEPIDAGRHDRIVEERAGRPVIDGLQARRAARLVRLQKSVHDPHAGEPQTTRTHGGELPRMADAEGLAARLSRSAQTRARGARSGASGGARLGGERISDERRSRGGEQSSSKRRGNLVVAGSGEVALFAGLDRGRGELSLDAVAAAAAPPPDPFDMSRLSVEQLLGLLRKLRGMNAVETVTPTVSAAAAAVQKRSLAEQVREAMADAPLGLLDEVCTMIDAAAAATTSMDADSKGGAKGRRGASSSKAGASGKSPKHPRHDGGGVRREGRRGSNHLHGTGVERNDTVATTSTASSIETRSSKDVGGGRRRHRDKREHRASPGHEASARASEADEIADKREQQRQERRAARQTRHIERRIDEALDPDREAVEARRAAARLERRIEHALQNNPVEQTDTGRGHGEREHRSRTAHSSRHRQHSDSSAKKRSSAERATSRATSGTEHPTVASMTAFVAGTAA